jgi:hypothetical protein
MGTVRSFPSELHSAGVEYLLYTLDRSLEDRKSGYCADWHAKKSQKYVTEPLRDTTVQTPKDIIDWLNHRERATGLHLA